MAKYDEERARQILETAADVLAPDLDARSDAARELIHEIGRVTRSVRITAAVVGDSEATLTIGDDAVEIHFTPAGWEVRAEGSAPIRVALRYDPHERKYVGDGLENKDGLAVILEAATDAMKNRLQSQAVQRTLGGMGELNRH
jgi:hypothetical protein